MPVLENLRKGTDSAVVRVGMGVVFFLFVAFFARNGSDKSGDRSMTFAKVNGTAITDTELRMALRNMEGQRKKSPSDDERKQMQTQALDNLISQEALIQEARRLGLEVAPEEVGRAILGIESLQKDGKFDEKTYQRWLKERDLTDTRFRLLLERDLLFEKLFWLASASVTVSDAEVKSAWREEGTEYTVTYVRLPAANFLETIPVSDADRDDYIAKNADRLKARYDEQFDRVYNLPKTYTVHAILLRTDLDGMDDAARAATKSRAEAILAEAKAGADFTELARRYSEDLSATKGGEMGALAANQLDPALAKVADETGAGKLSGVIETGRGYQILRVDDIQEARQVAFDEAKKDIAVGLIREDRVGDVTRAYATKLLGAWTVPGEPPRDLTEPMHLPVETTPAFTLAQPALPALADSAEMLAALKTARANSVLPVPFNVKGTLFLLALGDKTEPEEASFAAQQGMMRAQLLYQRKQEFLSDWTQAVKAKATVEMTQFDKGS